jgi:hypothetical protein
MAEAKLTITTNAQQVTDDLKQISDTLKDLVKSQREFVEILKQSAGGYQKTADAIKDTQKASQQLANEAERGLKREIGLIEDLEDRIKKWEEAKKKAWKVEDIEKFNKKIQEAKEELQDYETAGVKAQENITESTNKAKDSFVDFAKKAGILAAALAVVTKVLGSVVNALKDTAKGMGVVTRAQTLWNQAIYELSQLGKGESATLKELNEYSDRYIAFKLKQADVVQKNAKLQNEYNDLLVQAADNSKTDLQQANLMAQAEEKDQERRRNILANLKEELSLAKDLSNRQKESLTAAENVKRIENEILEIEGENRRLVSLRSAKEQADRDANLRSYLEWIDESLKNQEQYQKLALKLLDDYDKSQIASLEGKEKLIAQRDFGIKQLKEFRDQLAALGTLTDEQKIILQVMAENIWKEYYKALAEETKDIRPTEEQQKAISKALIGDFPELPGLIKKDVDAAREEIDKIINANEAMEPFSFWKILGLDPEDPEDSDFIAAFENAARTISNTIDDIYDKRVDDAQRRRELLDTQIAETQRSLDLELALFQDGYANNIDAKKKEVEELQKQREQALKNEEKALKAQRALETVMQTMNLITASSQLLKSAKDPITLALAIGSIVVMFGAFAAAKLKASQATKLAEGGYGDETGVIRGRSHAQGGEKFLDHVEVERGEAWGVLSRPASQKYGEIFHDMVSSFNKDQMPAFMPIANTVNVDNKGPNSRLDKVNSSINKLNQSILSQSQISHIGNKKIIKTGNKVRIVG